MNPAPLKDDSAPSGAVVVSKGAGGNPSHRHRLACRMLRKAGKLQFADLPPPWRSESLIDWLCRSGVAQSPQAASEGLIVAAGLAGVLDELLLPENGVCSD